MSEYTQGVCADGAAILKDGQPLTIDKIIGALRERDELKAHAVEVAAAVGFDDSSAYQFNASVQVTCIENAKRFSDQLSAIQREFFMVPGEPDEDYPDDEPDDECLVNRWASTTEQYVEQFRKALARRDLVNQAEGAELVHDRLREKANNARSQARQQDSAFYHRCANVAANKASDLRQQAEGRQ